MARSDQHVAQSPPCPPMLSLHAGQRGGYTRSTRGAIPSPKARRIVVILPMPVCCTACMLVASAAGEPGWILAMADRAPPRIFSRQRRMAGYRRALVRQSQRDAARYVLDDMVEDILDRLEFMRFEPARVLVIGDWTGTLALSLRGRGSQVEEANVRTIDEEKPIGDGSYDLIVSLASLGRVNDLPGALLHLRTALAEGGIVIASLIGAGSLTNLRRAVIAAEPDRPAGRMHPLVDNAGASALMQRALFKRQVVDSRSLEVAFGSLDRLVSDLRDQGLTSSLASGAPPLGKAALDRARKSFLTAANDRDRVIETFEILTLTGWKD